MPLIRKGCLKWTISRRERVVIQVDRRICAETETHFRPLLTLRAISTNSHRFLEQCDCVHKQRVATDGSWWWHR